MNKKGYFIVLEGPDKAGKSIQLPRVAEWLRSLGLDVVTTREPGGTFIGDQIRHVLLDKDNKGKFVPISEALLFQASRGQLVEEVIRPRLDEGKIVLCDRFKESSIVFQGFARGLGREVIMDLNDVSTSRLEPDLVVFLDIDVDTIIERRDGSGEVNRIDEEDNEFHQMVVDAYRQFYKEDQETTKMWERIDASKDIDEVFDEIKTKIEARLISAGLIERANLGKER